MLDFSQFDFGQFDFGQLVDRAQVKGLKEGFKGGAGLKERGGGEGGGGKGGGGLK